MRNTLTIAYVLQTLHEIKYLCDSKNFDSVKFLKFYPKFKSAFKAIQTKGIYNQAKNEFVNIEPNRIMAKEVLRLVSEERKQNLADKKMTSISKEEVYIDLEKKSYFESLELQILEVKKENLKLKQVAQKDSNLKHKIQVATNANSSLIKTIGEFQQATFLRNNNIVTLTSELAKANETNTYQQQKITEYEASLREFQDKGIVRANVMADNKKIIENQKETIRIQKQDIDELMDIVSEQRELIIKEKESEKKLKKSKKLKVFGITVYSLEVN